MHLFNLVVLSIMPLTMIGFGMLCRKNPPKTINIAFGYRTARSMKSQEAWDFAHRYVGKLWLYSGILTGALTAVIFMAFGSLNKEVFDKMMMTVQFTQIGCLLLAIVPTELALKRNFDKDGRRLDKNHED